MDFLSSVLDIPAPFLVLLVALVVIPLYYASLNLGSRYKHKAGHVMPGDKAPLILGALDSPAFEGLVQSAKYKSDVYIAWQGHEPVVMVGSADGCQDFFKDQVYGHTRDFKPCGQVFTSIFHECLGSFFGDRWLAARKMFNPPFSAKNVALHATDLGNTIRTWVAKVTDPSKPTEMELLTSGCDEIPLRTLTQLIFGNDETDADRQAVLKLLGLQRQLVSCMFAPSTRLPLYRKLAKWTRPNRLMDEFQAFYTGFFDRKLAQCRAGEKCMNGSIMADIVAQIDAGTAAINIGELYRTFYEIVFLNLDLAGSAVSWAVAHAALHEDAQARMREEIKQHFPVTPQEGESMSQATYRVVQKDLPYTSAFVKESARMCPALSVLLPPETMLKDTVIDGYLVPKGRKVAIDAYTLNYNTKYWAEPNKFHPERFLDPDHSRFAYFRFGMGTRMCLGYRFADFITKETLVSLLLTHDLTVVGSREARVRDEGMVNVCPNAPSINIRLTPLA